MSLQIFELLRLLDAFGCDRQAEVLRKRDDGRHDRGIFGIARHVADEGAVDLQNVARKALQVREGQEDNCCMRRTPNLEQTTITRTALA